MNASSATITQNIVSLLDRAVMHNEQITISTANGNAVLMSEDDYRGLIESAYISSIPGLKDDILAASAEPLSEAIPDDEVWR